MPLTRRSVLAGAMAALPFYGASLGVSAAARKNRKNSGRALIVRTTHGAVRGMLEGDIAVFRGIPFAAPPVGRLRFRAPEPAPRWRGVRDATQFGPMCPQNYPILNMNKIMGEFHFPQAEDNCLTLNVWTPPPDGTAVPVLVWIHGGGNISGSGRLPWYSGLSFARDGRIAVVTINYRLGPFGLMYLPGVAAGNMAALDQRAALRWVKENIGHFGGDPDNITVAGQSAGGYAVLTLMSSPENGEWFRRGILQSPGAGRPLLSAELAAELANEYVALLKLDKPTDIRRVPAEQLLTAYAELSRPGRRRGAGPSTFGAVKDGTVYSRDPVDALVEGNGRNSQVDLLIGTNRDEYAAQFYLDPNILNATDAQVRQRFEAVFGDRADAYLDEYQRMFPNATPHALLVHLRSDDVFLRKSLAVAEAQAKRGHPVHFYRFDWQSPVKALGACHCLELPFTFDNLENWPDALMLEKADPQEIRALARVMHQAWISFIKTGNPNHDRMPPWTPYDLENRTTMRFDNLVEPVGDLAGLRWRRPWITRDA